MTDKATPYKRLSCGRTVLGLVCDPQGMPWILLRGNVRARIRSAGNPLLICWKISSRMSKSPSGITLSSAEEVPSKPLAELGLRRRMASLSSGRSKTTETGSWTGRRARTASRACKSGSCIGMPQWTPIGSEFLCDFWRFNKERVLGN